MNWEDFKLTLKMKFQHKKLKKSFADSFKAGELTKENLIRFYNQLLHSKVNSDNDVFTMQAIQVGSENKYWFKINTAQDTDKMQIDIDFNVTSPNITITILSSREFENIGEKSLSSSYQFAEKIDIDCLVNKAVSYETLHFLTLLIEAIKECFVYTAYKL